MSEEQKPFFDESWTWGKCGKAFRSELARGLAITPRVLLVLLPGWLSGHFVILVRMVAAGAILFFVAAPVAHDGLKALPDTSALVSQVVTEFAYPVAATKKDSSDATDSEMKRPTHKVTNEESPVPQVWAYGIRATGLLAMLGLSLWAVVALLRED